MFSGFYTNKQKTRGFSFVEMIVTAAVVSLVFGGLFLTIQSALKLVARSKSMTGAIAVANEQIEYIRSLSYDDIGTEGGIPAGNIPQTSTTSLNGITYHSRIVVQYVDSPDDGVGGADTNGILADYKQVRVEYSWDQNGSTSTISALTNIVPPGIESTAGGGTLTVNVFDATVQPVSGASVHIYNDTISPTIDTIRMTNTDGVAMFAGAPAGSNYEIDVTKPDFSVDQTYSATTSNPNPITSHVAVLESQVSTMNFQIDELSDLLVRTVGVQTSASFTDDFDDMSLSTSSLDVVSVGGELVLSGGAGSYAAMGTNYSVPVTPGGFASWEVVDWNTTVPASTTLNMQIYSVSGTTYTLIPDTDLPGNSIGFINGPVDISGLDTATYTSIAIGTSLTSTDVNVTPAIDFWDIEYVTSVPSIGNIPFTLNGEKVIGHTTLLAPIYKYEEDHTTDGSGEFQINDIEWDVYSVLLGTGVYDIAEACPSLPYPLDPDVNETLTLTLVPSSTNSLRVIVVDGVGDPVLGADVTLSRSGYSDTLTSSTCGQVFFNSGIGAASDYQIDIQASGYSDQTITDIEIDGTETMSVTISS